MREKCGLRLKKSWNDFQPRRKRHVIAPSCPAKYARPGNSGDGAPNWPQTRAGDYLKSHLPESGRNWLKIPRLRKNAQVESSRIYLKFFIQRRYLDKRQVCSCLGLNWYEFCLSLCQRIFVYSWTPNSWPMTQQAVQSSSTWKHGFNSKWSFSRWSVPSIEGKACKWP